MKKLLSLNTVITTAVLVLLLIYLCIFFLDTGRTDYEPQGKDASVYLYGEAHGVKEIYNVEMEEWLKFYAQGCRDLFIELPFYEGNLLNMYMKADDEDILLYIYDCLEGTASYTESFLNFYREIKLRTPETVFHGTDIGHQYSSLGEYYLNYLESIGLSDSEDYKKAKEVSEQGRRWYEELDCDGEYRENKMVENFIYEYEKVVEAKAGEGINKSPVKIMGIYGGYHIAISDKSIMAGMLKEKLGDIISCKYVSNIYLNADPYKSGFSYLGLIFLIMLFVPNIIFSFGISDELKDVMAVENKALLVLERIGEVLACVGLLFIPANNPRLLVKAGICSFYSKNFGFFVMAIILMLLYEIYWIHYFRSKKQVADFYYPVLGIPFAGATLPCLAYLLLGIYSGNLFNIVSAVILAIGHIGIHYTDYMKWQKGE